MTTARAFQHSPALAPGARVAVIAPASSFARSPFESSLALIAARYEVHYQPAIFERHRYLAGSDGRRLGELTRALLDPAIRAVFCARGGYGATRLLAALAAVGPAPPKPLVGFSDITALHLWLQSRGVVSIHGPVLTQLGLLPAQTRQRLFHLLESSAPAPALSASDTYVPGVAE